MIDLVFLNGIKVGNRETNLVYVIELTF